MSNIGNCPGPHTWGAAHGTAPKGRGKQEDQDPVAICTCPDCSLGILLPAAVVAPTYLVQVGYHLFVDPNGRQQQ